MTRHIEIRKNTYLDSVSLMSMSTKANAVEGVTQALLGMATPMNKEVLANVGVNDAAVDEARPSDLMIVIDAIPGPRSGTTIEKKVREGLAPSTAAASSSWLGSVRMNPTITKMLNGRLYVA